MRTFGASLGPREFPELNTQSVPRLGATSKQYRKSGFRSLKNLDFSYLRWYSQGGPFLDSFGIHGSYDTNQLFQARMDWGTARRQFFISNLQYMKDLQTLNLSGYFFPPGDAPALCAALPTLSITDLDLSYVRRITVDDILRAFRTASPLTAALRKLSLNDTTFDSSLAVAIGSTCASLEELYWMHPLNPDPLALRNLSDAPQHLRALGAGCRKLRRFFAPKWSRVQDWLGAFVENLEMLGLSELQIVHFPGNIFSLEAGEKASVLLALNHVKDKNIWRIQICGRFPVRQPHWRFVSGPIHSLLCLDNVLCRQVEEIEDVVKFQLSTSGTAVAKIDSERDEFSQEGLSPFMYVVSSVIPAAAKMHHFIDHVPSYVSLHSPVYGISGIIYATTTPAFSALAGTRKAALSILENNPEIWRCSQLNKTGLIWMTMVGNVKERDTQERLVKAALSSEVDINAKDLFGFTALHYAVLRNSRTTIDILLKNGANPFVQSSTGRRDSPIQLALRIFRSQKVLHLLLPTREHTDRFLTTYDLSWGLLLALELGNSKLVDKVALLANQVSSNGFTECVTKANCIYPVLVAAARAGHHKLRHFVGLRGALGGVDLNASLPQLTPFGVGYGSILHYVVHRRDPRSLKCLLDELATGAVDLGKRDGFGRTPLIVACKHGQAVNCVVVLLERMRGNSSLLNATQTKRSYTALHWTTTWTKKDEPTLRLLLATSGFNLTQQDGVGNTVGNLARSTRYPRRQCALLHVFQEVGLE